MKTIVPALMDSPFYFSMDLQERYALIKRLANREPEIDLQAYWRKVYEILETESSLINP